MSSVPPSFSPILNPTGSIAGTSPGATTSTVDPLSLNSIPFIPDTVLEDTLVAIPMVIDPHAGGTLPFPGFVPPLLYASKEFSHPPVGPTPCPGGDPTEAFANGPNTRLVNPVYTEFEFISDLVSPASLDFE